VGTNAAKPQALDGAEEIFCCRFSAAPAGAWIVVDAKPTADAVGYYRPLLRSFSILQPGFAIH